MRKLINSMKGDIMSASYVAGTAPGAGMAKNQRGPGNGRDHFVAKTNPHIVQAGVAVAAINTVTIVPGTLPTGTIYGILATNMTGTTVYVTPTYTANVLTKFVLTTSGPTDYVTWALISLGSGMNGANATATATTTTIASGDLT